MRTRRSSGRDERRARMSIRWLRGCDFVADARLYMAPLAAGLLLVTACGGGVGEDSIPSASVTVATDVAPSTFATTAPPPTAAANVDSEGYTVIDQRLLAGSGCTGVRPLTAVSATKLVLTCSNSDSILGVDLSLNKVVWNRTIDLGDEASERFNARADTIVYKRQLTRVVARWR